MRESGDFEGVVHVFRIVENSLARIAGNDLIVFLDFLIDLRPDPHLADLADFIARRRNADSATVFAYAVILRGRDQPKSVAWISFRSFT